MVAEKKQNRFIEIKAEDDGTLVGCLSSYGFVDNGGDLIERSAYKKTIIENKGQIPILWGHDPDQPIGMGDLTDTDAGLMVKIRLLVGKGIQKAEETYQLVKADIVKGLSIGFKAIQSERKDGIRRISEIKLYEGSVVLWPMDPNAQIMAVKSMQDGTGDFVEELDELQTASAGCDALRVLDNGLIQAWWNLGYLAYGQSGPTSENLLTYAGEFIDQFKVNFMAAMEKYAGMVDAGDADEMKALILKAKTLELERKSPKPAAVAAEPIETKVGKKISGETATHMKAAQDHLTAATESMKSAHTILNSLYEEPAAKSTENSGAEDMSDEPDQLHSAVLAELKGLNALFDKIPA